jgi:hypothetical protein
VLYGPGFVTRPNMLVGGTGGGQLEAKAVLDDITERDLDIAGEGVVAALATAFELEMEQGGGVSRAANQKDKRNNEYTHLLHSVTVRDSIAAVLCDPLL